MKGPRFLPGIHRGYCSPGKPVTHHPASRACSGENVGSAAPRGSCLKEENRG